MTKHVSKGRIRITQRAVVEYLLWLYSDDEQAGRLAAAQAASILDHYDEVLRVADLDRIIACAAA